MPPWPEEPEGGGATGDWIQRGQAYAEGVRLWRAQLRNAPESTKGVVDQLLRHLHDTGQLGVWDQLVYGAIKPEVQGSPDYERWQACTKLISPSALTLAQMQGVAILCAKDQDLTIAVKIIADIARDEAIGLECVIEGAFIAIHEFIEEYAENPCANNSSTWAHEVKLLGDITNFLVKFNQALDSSNAPKATHFQEACNSGLSRLEIVKCSDEFTQLLRSLRLEESRVQGLDSSQVNPSLSAFFEYKGVRMATNQDKATEYHIRESTSKLERLSMFVPEDAKVVIDCGAHAGLFSAMAANQANEAEIYLVEPDSDMHCYIAYNMPRKSHYVLYGCALGGAQGTGTFFKSLDSSQTSSLSREATDHFSEENGHKERTVEVNRLSDLLFLIEDRIDYLKIDIQGQEMAVINDLADTGMLDKVDILALESSFLDYNSIRCTEILKSSGGFSQALIVNSVYGGADILWHRSKADLSGLCSGIYKLT